MRGGRGKGGTIGMLKSVMRGSGKFIATQPKSSNLLLPPALFLPPNPWDENVQCTCPGWISVKTKYNTSLIYSVRAYFLNVTIVYFQTFPFITCFFFHYTILYLYFLNFLLQVTCLHFSLSPKIFLIFFHFYISPPCHAISYYFFFFTYIIFSCSFNTFLIFFCTTFVLAKSCSHIFLFMIFTLASFSIGFFTLLKIYIFLFM